MAAIATEPKRPEAEAEAEAKEQAQAAGEGRREAELVPVCSAVAFGCLLVFPIV
jgi:hypothetical protein